MHYKIVIYGKDISANKVTYINYYLHFDLLLNQIILVQSFSCVICAIFLFSSFMSDKKK
jgi:hypothetical protein